MGVYIAPQTSAEKNFIDYIESGMDNVGYLTGERALQNSDVFTGVNIIGGDIGKSLFRKVPDEHADQSFLQLINKRPHEKQSHYTFMYATVAQLILYGNSYAIIHREKENDYNSPIKSLEFVTADQVNLIQDMTTGEWRYDVTLDYGNHMLRCEPRDILHFRISVVDGFIGRSPLLSLRDEIGMQTNGNKIVSRFFANGVCGGGILKLNKGYVDNATKKKIREDFERANGGSTNSNGVIVLDEATDFTEYKMNTDILKLIQSNKFSTQQIAKVLGIPLNRFGMELVNSTDSGANDIYIASTISQYERAICDEIEIKTGNELELDLTTLLNDTYEDRRKRVFEGKQNKELLKAIKTNEIRDYLGYADVEEGEELMKVDGQEGVSASEES